MATTEKEKSQASPTPEGGTTSGDAPAEELGTMIDELLGDLSNKFTTIASELTAKMDDMSRRIDNLEASMQHSQRGKEAGDESNS